MKSKPIKVLYIIDTLEIGGAEGVCLDIYLNVDQKKINPQLLVIKSKTLTQYVGLKNENINYLNRISKSNILTYFKLFVYLLTNDIIHVHLRHSYRYVKFTQLLFYPFLFRKKLILHDHSFKNTDILFKAPINYLLKPTYCILVTDSLLDNVKNKLNLKEGQISVFNNLIPEIKESNHLTNSSESLKINQLVIVGNIKYIKNQKFALQVANNLNRNLDIIGKIQDEIVYKELLNQNKGKLNIIENITDVKTVLMTYRVGLFTSFNESGPIVLLEYLNCNLPFVSTKIGSIGHILSNYFPEFFIDEYDLFQWQQRIVELENGYQIDNEKVSYIMNKHFNRSVYFDRLVQVYKELK